MILNYYCGWRNSTIFTSPLHGKLPGYPIFRDFSEIKRMRTTVCTHPVRKPNPAQVLGKMENLSTRFTGKGFTVCADLTPLLRPTIAQRKPTVVLCPLLSQWPGECAWSCLLWKWLRGLKQALFTVVFEGVQRVTTLLLLLVLVMDVRVWRRKMHLTPVLSLPLPLRLNHQTLVKDEQVMNLMWACLRSSRRQLLQHGG